jgi:hypothetical protein
MKQFLPNGPNYAPARQKLSADEFAFCKAYMNGCHDNNYMKNPGAPMSPGNDTYTIHTMLRAPITPDVNNRVSIVFTGIPEAPLLVGDTQNSTTKVYQWSAMPTNGTTWAHTPVAYTDWFKQHGVEAYRCINLQCRIDNTTAVINKEGDVITGRNPKGVDLNPVIDAADTAQIQLGIRTVETMPLIDSTITTMTNNAYAGKAEDGVYWSLPSLDPMMPFVYRDQPYNKGVYSVSQLTATTTNINDAAILCCNALGVKFGTGSNVYMPAAWFSNGGTVANRLTLATAIDIIPAHETTMMSQLCLFYNLSAETKLTALGVSSWELITSVGSDLQQGLHACVPSNPMVMALAANAYRGMPGGYPASANFLNELWDKFKGAYNDYISPFAGSFIKNLPPEYAAIGSGAKTALDLITGAKEAAKAATTAAQSATAAAKQVSATTSSSGQGRYRK